MTIVKNYIYCPYCKAWGDKVSVGCEGVRDPLNSGKEIILRCGYCKKAFKFRLAEEIMGEENGTDD